MQFELTNALIDDILFAMEDQHSEYVLDTHKAIVFNQALDDPEEDEDSLIKDRYIDLPEWTPDDGFRLMEHFTAKLHNPVVQQELTKALDRGRGVFRAFKDALSQRPEIEKLWFNFKDREMKRGIIAWYNGLREMWGMEKIGSEPDDIEGLVHEDFRFRAGAAADRKIAEETHRICHDTFSGSERVHSLAAEITEGINQGTFPGDLCIAAETAGGDFAGYISAVYAAPSFLHIRALEVRPEYRSMGLGQALLSRLLELADSKGITRISIDLPGGSEYFSRVLLRDNFVPCVQRFCRDTR